MKSAHAGRARLLPTILLSRADNVMKREHRWTGRAPCRSVDFNPRAWVVWIEIHTTDSLFLGRRSGCCGHNRLRGSAGASPSHRSGLTLFEVLLALAIFLGALAAIAQIVEVGTLASSTGRLKSEAVLRCETKLAEVVSGIEPMSSVQGQAFDDDTTWNWKLTLADGPHPDLLQLTVDVSHTRTNGTTDADFSLTRLVRDPQLFIDAAAAAQEVE